MLHCQLKSCFNVLLKSLLFVLAIKKTLIKQSCKNCTKAYLLACCKLDSCYLLIIVTNNLGSKYAAVIYINKCAKFVQFLVLILYCTPRTITYALALCLVQCTVLYQSIVINLYQLHVVYVTLIGAVAITLEQKQHKERESEMKGDKRTLKIEIKEMELAHEEMVKNLKKVMNHITKPCQQ